VVILLALASESLWPTACPEGVGKLGDGENRGRHDVRRVAIPDIEHVMRLMFVRADEPALQRHVVAQQRVGNHALAAPEILARVACLHGRPLHAELLTGAMDATDDIKGLTPHPSRANGTASVATIPWGFTYLCWNIPTALEIPGSRARVDVCGSWRRYQVTRRRMRVGQMLAHVFQA